MSLKNTTINKAKDTGLALVLILLIVLYIRQPGWLALCAMGALVLTMVWPAVFKPLAKIWFGLSHFLGTIVSKIILSLVFFLIVTPMGLIRKAFGADPMKAKLWKKGEGSVLVDRDHLYTKEDIEKPY
jgi:energy-coupling factor transporter transmembrane protein EcfT